MSRNNFTGPGWYYWEKDPLKGGRTRGHWVDGADETGRAQLACGKTDNVPNVALLPHHGEGYRCQVCERRLKRRAET